MGFIKSRARGEVYLEPRAQCVGYEDRKEVCATKESVHIQLKGRGVSISISLVWWGWGRQVKCKRINFFFFKGKVC